MQLSKRTKMSRFSNSKDARKFKRVIKGPILGYRKFGPQDQTADRLFKRLTTQEASAYGSDKEFASAIKNEFKDNYQLRDVNINIFVVAIIFISFHDVRSVVSLQQKFTDSNIQPMLLALLSSDATKIKSNPNKYKEVVLKYICYILISRGVQGIPF